MRILLVEDDAVLGDAINRSLIKAGYAVDWATDGHAADLALHDELYDAVVLDLGLPRLDGLDVLRRLRQRKVLTPVVILSAREGVDDRIRGLDLGADDYLTKPFKLPELEARLRAQIRRSHQVASASIELGRLKFDTKERIASVGEEVLELSQRELGVLEVLVLRKGRVVSKDSLVEYLCNWNEDVGSNAIEVYVHRLRKKLETHGIEIRTIRGLGYLLEAVSE